MKVALISPKGPLYRHRGGIFKKSLRYQPLTLTTLVALAPSELNIEFQLIDEGIEDIPDNLDAELIGMTVITGTAPRSYELARRLRAAGKTVVLGGPHVTLMPQEAAKNADAICVGYAENSWPQLLRDYKKNQLKERYDQGMDFNLDNPVFVDRSLLDKRKFITQAVFEATRACAHACDFCVSPVAWGRKQYQKPPEHVAEDIRRVGSSRNIFVDLNLISDRNYATRLFTALEPLGIKWFGLVTSLIGHDRELMELMERSGCSGVLIGFESISSQTLGGLGKKFNQPDKYMELINDLHRLNISIYGCFVFGNDEDTNSVFEETAKFVIDAAIDLPRFAIQTPFPGTPLFRKLKSEGRILNENWELYDGQHVVHQPLNMSVDELQEGHVKAWRDVYSHSAIAKRLAKSRTQLPIAVIANFGYRFYAYHLHTHYTCDWAIGYDRSAAA